MNMQARIVVAVLATVVLALAPALGVVLATDDGDGSGTVLHGMDRGDGFMGMVQAMGDMDSDGMVRHMRDVLGEDGHRGMLEHLRDHQEGGPMMAEPAISDMMHGMTDGMMERMP